MCQIVGNEGKQRMLNGYVSSVYAFANETDFVIKSILHPAYDMDGLRLHDYLNFITLTKFIRLWTSRSFSCSSS